MSLAKQWEKWKGEPSHWHNLDGYFKPIVTRFFITWFATAPLVASLIEKYPGIFVLPFDWWILWLASLSYAISFAVHAWKCPQFIKRYPTYLAYQARGHSPRWLVWEFHSCWSGVEIAGRKKLERRVIEKSYVDEAKYDTKFQERPQVTESGTVFQFHSNNINYNLTINENASDEFVKDFFWEIFGRWTGSDAKMRLTTWSLLSISILLVSITVIQDIIFVASLI